MSVNTEMEEASASSPPRQSRRLPRHRRQQSFPLSPGQEEVLQPVHENGISPEPSPLESVEESPLEDPFNNPAFFVRPYMGSRRASQWTNASGDTSDSMRDGASMLSHSRSQRASQSDGFKSEVRLLYLREQQLEKRWADDDHPGGIMLRTGRGNYLCQPRDLAENPDGFYEEMKMLKVKVCD